MDNQFKKQFIRKFGEDYRTVVRELKRSAEWQITFYGSAEFLRVAENLKKAVEAQDVLDKLGEKYTPSSDFRAKENAGGEEFRRWARTPGFVDEYYAQLDVQHKIEHAKYERKREIEDTERRRINRLVGEALRPPKESVH